jgi:hypothetical protein
LDIHSIKSEIDEEISKRTSENIGIKVSENLYKELGKAGLITRATFSVLGTGVFAEELPAYDGKYYIFPDWELEGYKFKVGTPTSRP